MGLLRKTALLLGLTVCLAGTGMASAAQAEKAPSGLRYFMQKPGVKGSSTPYGNNLKQGHYIQAGDAKLYYEVYGTPETGSVIVVSTRGHGRSEIGHTPLTYEQKAQDMLTVMRTVTRRPATLLGFSDGAYTAYEVAVLAPQAVDRLVAIRAGTLKAGYFKPGLTVEDLRKTDPAFVEQQLGLMPEPGGTRNFSPTICSSGASCT